MQVCKIVGLREEGTIVRKALRGGYGGGDSALPSSIDKEEE